MAPKYPAIPEPTLKPESLRDTILSVKQAFEVLTGQRGNPDYRAVLLPELTASDNADDAAIANLANNAAVRYDIAQALSSPAKAQAATNIGLGVPNPVQFDQLRVTRSIDVSGTDLNALLTGGFYNGATLVNGPDASNWYFIAVQTHSNNNLWVLQQAWPLTSAGGYYIRNRLNGVWTAWTQSISPPDTWHPFAYQNGWVDYSAPYSPAGYRKLSSGLVVLRGLTMSGTAAGIATLPAGYRPGIQLLFSVQTNPNVACRIDVTTAGAIQHTGGSNVWLSLAGITFLAEQ